MTEEEIAEKYVTRETVDATRSRIRSRVLTKGANVSDLDREKVIPLLLESMYYIVVGEFISDHPLVNSPEVDYDVLRKCVTVQTKRHAGDLF